MLNLNDLYIKELGIYNRDCMDLLKNIPDNQFGLLHIDPPYGIKEDGRNHKGIDGTPVEYSDRRTGKGFTVKAQDYKLDANYDNSAPDQSMFDELFRVSKYQIIWGCNYFDFNQKSTSSGRIIWDKVNGECDQSDCEIAWTNLFSSVRQVEYMWNGMLQGKSIKEGRVQQGNKRLNEKRRHPNHKPSILFKYIFDRWCKKEWAFIDPMFGSGSSIIAADNFGFSKIIGCEIDPDYYHGACEWVVQIKKQLKFNLK